MCFSKLSKKKGFTLVEMLVVIAIIAILVAILVPTVMGATTKAKAATDAANLRAVQSVLNITLLDSTQTSAQAAAKAMSYACKSFSGAKTYALIYSETFVEIYYVVDDSSWYGVDYFSQLAITGNKNDSTLSSYVQTKAALEAKGTLVEVSSSANSSN